MKIATFADLHLGVSTYSTIDPTTGLNTRCLDALKSLDEMIDKCIQKDVKYVFFAGDAFKNALPSPTLTKELNARIRKMVDNGMTLYLMDGNHDVSPLLTAKSAMDPMNTLKVNNVYHTRFEKEYDIQGYRLLVLPTYTNQSEIEEILKKYDDDKKTLIMGHFTALGAKMNDWLLAQNEEAVDCSIFKKKNILAVILGHLHKHQILSTKPLAYYTGSLQRIDFNEEKQDKGFVILDIDGDNVDYEFVKINSQQFLTVKRDLKGIDDPMESLTNYLDSLKNLDDKIIRINLSADKNHNINDTIITKLLRDKGCKLVASINKEIDRKELIRNENINASITEEEALREYFTDDEDAEELIKLGFEMIQELKSEGDL